MVRGSPPRAAQQFGPYRLMAAYIIRRLLLMIPTLFGIMVLNFFIVQLAPGGPIEQMLAEMQGTAVSATARLSGDGGAETGQSGTQGGIGVEAPANARYRGAQGLDPDFIAQLERQFGFDKPMHERFVDMMLAYLRFDFGQSYFLDRDVVDLVLDKMPVSISLGLWTTLLVYGVSIPLGIKKAVSDGSRFDVWTSALVVVGNAIPAFLFAVLLIVLFAGGQYFDWFPLRGLLSPGMESEPWWRQVLDYFWHLALPVLAMTVASFASLTMLTKNSFLEQINQQYVQTARAKGVTEHQVLYGHVFRNAMLIIISGFPAAFIGVFLTGSLIIETIFSLDGLGLRGFEAVINRDYPVMFATLYVFTLLGLVMRLISDVVYTVVDPRIDFGRRG